jgi:hypothetical protein
MSDNTNSATNAATEENKANVLPKLLAQQLMEKVAQMNMTTPTPSKQQEAVMHLLNHISNNKSRTNDKFFILSAAYDKLYKKYNNISLLILILSSVVTLVEAFRLSIVDFINKSDNDTSHIEIISFCMNIMTLFTGTIITILSSIIRFKNYREILEQLKDKQNLLINYREKYSKKYEKILNLLAFDCLTKEDIISIHDRIIEYDNDIKTINVMEYLRNEDILKFNKYKTHFDFEMYKMDVDKEIAIKRYEKSVGLTMDEIKKNQSKANNHGYMRMRGLKEFLLRRTKNANTDTNTIISPNVL